MVVPAGVVGTEFVRVRQVAGRLGIAYDRWQVGLGRLILAQREDGLYAAGIGGVVLSIARQVGKTFLIGSIVVILCLIKPNLKVVWTSHHDRTTRATFKSLVALCRRRRVAPFILAIRQANGQREIEFTNGSVIMFGARGSGYGRGDDAIDVIVFDEAQILTQRAMDDLVPTANVAPNPLVILLGTPPKPSDPSEVFKGLRREALKGENPDVAFVEISADRDADLDDPEQYAKANPSFPHRTRLHAIKRLRNLLGDDSFRREGLGIWDSDAAGSRLITVEQWEATQVTAAPAGVTSFGVAFSLDGRVVSLAGCRKHVAGFHVEIIPGLSGTTEAGVKPLARWLAARWRSTAQIVISGRAGAPTLFKALREEGVPEHVIHLASTPEYTAACAFLLDGVQDRSVTHLTHSSQTALDSSVAVSDKKARGVDGAWGWEATTPDGDETPAEAASLALFAARTATRVPGGRQQRL